MMLFTTKGKKSTKFKSLDFRTLRVLRELRGESFRFRGLRKFSEVDGETI
jgi:hypothetical protein